MTTLNIFVLVLLIHILVLTIFVESRYECSSGTCSIDCRQQNCGEVICTNTATSCSINCGETDCANSNIYIAATQNTVTCNGDDSCKNINIFCGIPDNIPSGFTKSQFEGHIDSCNIKLYDEAIPDAGFIKCFHDIDVCQVQVMSGSDNFKVSDFQCELSPENSHCLMSCANSDACGDGTSTFRCNAPSCSCIGSCGQIDYQHNTAPPSTSSLGTTTTSTPTAYPTAATEGPTIYPTTLQPTFNPSIKPSNNPTASPSNYPISSPSDSSTPSPSNHLTPSPSNNPTPSPSDNPTIAPTKQPTISPTASPTVQPTSSPLSKPSIISTKVSSDLPTEAPSRLPTAHPIYIPSINPTINTSPMDQTYSPSKVPTTYPSVNPSVSLTVNPKTVSTVSIMDKSDENTSKEEHDAFGNIDILYIVIGCMIIFCVCCGIFLMKRVKNPSENMKQIKNFNVLSMTSTAGKLQQIESDEDEDEILETDQYHRENEQHETNQLMHPNIGLIAENLCDKSVQSQLNTVSITNENDMRPNTMDQTDRLGVIHTNATMTSFQSNLTMTTRATVSSRNDMTDDMKDSQLLTHGMIQKMTISSFQSILNRNGGNDDIMNEEMKYEEQPYDGIIETKRSMTNSQTKLTSFTSVNDNAQHVIDTDSDNEHDNDNNNDDDIFDEEVDGDYITRIFLNAVDDETEIV